MDAGKRRRAGLLVAGLLGAIACEREQPLVSPPAAPAAPTTPANTGAPPAPAPFEAGVVVEDAGAEPRRALGPAPAPDARQSLRLRVETQAGAGAPGGPTARMQTPAAEIDLTVVAPGAGPGGLTLDAARSPAVAAAPDAPAPAPSLVGLFESTMAPLVGARGAYARTPGAPPKAWRFDAPAGTSAPTAEVLASVNDALADFDLRLPDVPVGAGARWLERVRLGEGPMALQVTRRVTLTRFGAEGAELLVAMEIGSAQGGARTPAVGGASGGVTGRGAGTLVVDPARPLPVRGALEIETRTTHVGGGREDVAGQWALETRVRATLVPR